MKHDNSQCKIFSAREVDANGSNIDLEAKVKKLRKNLLYLCLTISLLPQVASVPAGAAASPETVKYNSPFQKRPAQEKEPPAAPAAQPVREPARNTSAPPAASLDIKERENIVHVLNRLTFGPSPRDIATVHTMGIDAYIEQQLHPETIPEPQTILDFTGSTDALTKTPDALFTEYSSPAINAAVSTAVTQQNLDPKSDEAKNLENKLQGDFQRQVIQDTVKNKLMRAIESPRQLQEVMTEFWFNHFNVYFYKGNIRYTLGAFERQALRPYALGKFRDLVGATCHHAAMMDYLDNSSNSAPVKVGNNMTGLNENYARELMELHTLGVDGGYTQNDVIELARILTGLTVSGHDYHTGAIRTDSCDSGTFFNTKRHDFGDKVLLGKNIKGSGEDEIETALDMLCKSPATARHISFQLAQYFVCDNPPQALVKHLASKFLSSDGNIKVVLNELFHSKEFMDPANANVKFKSPLRYIVSVVRATHAKVTDYNRLAQFLNGQGEPLYSCLTPDGYKNVKDAWLNPDALLHRANFAIDFAAGHFNGVEGANTDVRSLENTLGIELGSGTQASIDKAPANAKAAVLLGSPEFMQY
jgi:uncharacterized protein (DUF1800 family)